MEGRFKKLNQKRRESNFVHRTLCLLVRALYAGLHIHVCVVAHCQGAHVYHVCGCLGVHLVPNLEEAVPAARADRHAVLCDPEAGHTVIVTREHTCSLRPERVPNVSVEVVIPREEETTRLAERHARDAADNVVVAVHAQLLVRPDVEHTTRGVITSGRKSVAIGKEHYRVYITFMSSEGLYAVRPADIPQLGRSVAGPGDESFLIW